VVAYWQRLKSRDGFQRALQSQHSTEQGVAMPDLRVTS